MAMPSDDKRPDETPDDVPFEAGPFETGAETATLDLQDVDERLPWLESDDDADQTRDEGGRLFGFVVGLLVALVAIVGGIWWVSHRGASTEAVADGGVIEAPETPYKEAPQNPGGKTFAGTGDSSFAVSEGQTRAARLGQESPAGATAAAPKPSASAAPKAEGGPAAKPEPQGVGVQVGAYSSKSTAEAGWARLQQQNEALSGVAHRVVEGKADIGTVYRLQAVPGDLAAANALCSRLKSAGVACQVKR